jgi:hypothetical protein
MEVVHQRLVKGEDPIASDNEKTGASGVVNDLESRVVVQAATSTTNGTRHVRGASQGGESTVSSCFIELLDSMFIKSKS